VKVLLAWGVEGQPYKYMLVFCLLYDFSPFITPGWTDWRRCWVASFWAELNWSELMMISFPQTTVLYFQPYATSVAVFLLWKEKKGGVGDKQKDTYVYTHTRVQHTHTIPWSWHFTFGPSFLFSNCSVTYLNLPVQTQYSLYYTVYLVMFASG